MEKGVVQKKRTMVEWNGSFKEILKNFVFKKTKKKETNDFVKFERTWKNYCFCTQLTNFSKDLEKTIDFYWTNDFLEQT